MARVLVAWLAAAALCGFSRAAAAAEPRDPAELLPASTLFYAEAPHPDQLIDLVTDHPLRAKLQEIDGYKKALASPQYVQFQLGVVLVESQLGQGWRPALKAATAGGVTIAFDGQTEGAVLLVRAEDAAVLRKVVKTFTDLARQDAKGKGRPDPIEEDSYREVKVYKAGKAGFAVHDDWLVVVNKGELGKSVIDRLLDAGGETLAASERFKAARAARDGDSSAWAYADMEGVRAAGPKGPLETGHTDNPIAELLVGGLIDNLQKTPYVTAALALTADRVSVAFGAPHEDAWVSEGRRYFFGPTGEAGPAPIRVDQSLLTLTTYRDLSQMWLRAGDLFDQNMADELAKADSNLSTLFGGRDFGEEVLGSVGPELQLVVARQDFADVKPRPAVKLPGFALVGTLKDPETMKGELRRTFMSLIGFLNVVGAMAGQPQLDFDLEKQGENQTVVTRYLPEPDEADSTEARINFNFSPSIAFVGDRVIVSSTAGLARDIAEALQTDDTGIRQPSRANSFVELDASVLRDALADNREQLIAQNMLSEGRDRPEAEAAIDALITLVGYFRDATLRLDAADGRLGLRLDVALEP